ncbi:aminotransferase class I/II-fold pyridoxal phosphate-dependent enzyme [Streptomyces sp. NPDC094468]|uniref:aminotransferase class I/II-fold pyridoxal phosphate-dependent enzyme n=1 Tax=Streptomyces sp. NPDC094468 TaxID=3366066 RepID=UPI0038242D0C
MEELSNPGGPIRDSPATGKFPPFLLENWIREYRGRCTLDIGGSDVQALTLENLLRNADDHALEAWRSVALGYGSNAGPSQLRALIAELYEGIDEDGIRVLSGTTEAFFATALATLPRGGHVIVVGPTYQLLSGVFEAAGAKVTVVEMVFDEGWKLDLDRLSAAWRPDTTVVVLNNPNNPTGTVYDPRSVSALATLAGDRGAYLIMDEIYGGVGRSNENGRTGVKLGPHVVSLGGLSKVYGLAGLRVGWVASSDRALLERIRDIRYWTTLTNGVINEILARMALRQRHGLLARARAILHNNEGLLRQFIERHSDIIEWSPPTGGTTAYPRLHRGDSSTISQRLAVDYGIFTVPSSVVPSAGQHLRIGLGRTDVPRALEIMDEALPALIKSAHL